MDSDNSLTYGERDTTEAGERLVVTRAEVVDAIQTAWDDFVGDTGCFPDAITVVGRGPKLSLEAGRGNWATFITDWLNAALAARPAPVAGQAECDGTGSIRVGTYQTAYVACPGCPRCVAGQGETAEQCLALSAPTDPWTCTLPAGHPGDHEAHGHDRAEPHYSWPAGLGEEPTSPSAPPRRRVGPIFDHATGGYVPAPAAPERGGAATQ